MEDAKKFCIIMRGIPGSGKSTTARFVASSVAPYAFRDKNRTLVFGDHQAVIHSTDEQFTSDDGVYIFDGNKIALYHNYNYRNFVESIELGIKCVIVDNTNTTAWEYEKYEKFARKAGYIVSVMKMPVPTIEESMSRNTHGLSRDVIEKMIKRWQD
jgi:tRNA uridine 5-carbamoylmethylation protein Kti12